MDEDRILNMVMIFLNQNLPYFSCWTLEWLLWWVTDHKTLWFWYIGDQFFIFLLFP